MHATDARPVRMSSSSKVTFAAHLDTAPKRPQATTRRVDKRPSGGDEDEGISDLQHGVSHGGKQLHYLDSAH